jgi:chromosome segregation ATPase
MVSKLQTKVERMNSQLRHTENENRRLNTELATLSSELAKRSGDKENLERALEATRKTTTDNSVKSIDVMEMWTEEAAPLIAQHELQIKQLQKIESNMATGEGLVTDRNVLEEWTQEDEALHAANIQLEELKQKLAVSERLESDLATSKLDLEKVTKEKEELLIRLEAATKELLECKRKIADTELHDAELGRYAQVLNVEKITLMGQLELLRGELDKQKEAARIAQMGANKVSTSLLNLKLFLFERWLLR